MARKVTIQSIAKSLVQKNPELRTIVENNPGQSYKALESRITNRLCGKIAKAKAINVQRNKLIWGIINEVDGQSEDELDF